MTASIVSPPSYLPTLSAGRHRTPKRGACFMEYASFLAGERWSDHPSCTHPVLAAIARGVNDLTSASTRNELAVHIPRVIGLRSEDPVLALRLALRAGLSALPVASMERQRALAVGVRHMLVELDRYGAGDDATRQEVADVFALVPDADRWSYRFCLAVGHAETRSPLRSCEAMATVSVLGIAEACVPDTDARLRRLLEESIGEAERHIGTAASVTPAPEPAARIPEPARR
ncbi:hypothetical protein [Naasia sp. SYSU D00057]|uniref:hypothetical protein n=1 Tax=Naasia sp. SYSU D00057 TaxID=2817380 RepID=UPI001B30E582|nr:hypothetical protein [Naasia sp. SYSU D00057]